MKTCLKCSSLEFLLSQSGLLSLQGLDPLQNVGVLDVGFHPGGQGSSCCASTFCILKNKAKIRRTRCEKEHRSLPSAGAAVRRAAASPCTFGSKEAVFLLSSSSTLWRISGVMLLASKVAMSSRTPRLARKLQNRKEFTSGKQSEPRKGKR